MKSGWFDREEKPFNMAQLLLERINKRFEEANESGVEGDIFRWYRCLRAIKSAIYFKIESDKDKVKVKKDDEEEEIGVEEYVNSLVTKASVTAKTAVTKKDEMYYFVAEKDLVRVEEYLIKLAYKYKLYYPHYENKTWEERAEDEDV